MVDITQDKIRIRAMVLGDAAALLKWMHGCWSFMREGTGSIREN